MGYRAVQFIGGEPTLHCGLPELITRARALRYEHVEVYTNGTVLPDTLLSCFVDNWVSMAVSVYADDPDIHDAVTRRTGSHRRTISNLQRMVAAGLDVRIGLIAMDVNKGRVDNTVSFLRALGIENVRIDVTRSVGRGGGPPCWGQLAAGGFSRASADVVAGRRQRAVIGAQPAKPLLLLAVQGQRRARTGQLSSA